MEAYRVQGLWDESLGLRAYDLGFRVGLRVLGFSV